MPPPKSAPVFRDPLWESLSHLFLPVVRKVLSHLYTFRQESFKSTTPPILQESCKHFAVLSETSRALLNYNSLHLYPSGIV